MAVHGLWRPAVVSAAVLGGGAGSVLWWAFTTHSPMSAVVAVGGTSVIYALGAAWITAPPSSVRKTLELGAADLRARLDEDPANPWQSDRQSERPQTFVRHRHRPA